MELIKRHKGLAIVGSLTLILLIILFAIFARMIFSSEDSEYGSRLKGLNKVDKKITEKVIEETKALDEVENIKIRIQGKIIYTTIIYTPETSRERAIEIAGNTLTQYDETITKQYDFEYLLTQNKEVAEGEEDTSFKVAGTKHPDREYISWTK